VFELKFVRQKRWDTNSKLFIVLFDEGYSTNLNFIARHDCFFVCRQITEASKTNPVPSNCAVSASSLLPNHTTGIPCIHGWVLAVWSGRCIGILKVAGSSPTSGSGWTFYSGLLLKVFHCASYQYLSAHCVWLLTVLPRQHTLFSAPRASQEDWVSATEIPKFMYMHLFIKRKTNNKQKWQVLVSWTTRHPERMIYECLTYGVD
jgi:hypothetical protein